MEYKIFILTIKRNIKREKDVIQNLKDQGFSESEYEVFYGTDYKTLSDNQIKNLKSKYGYFCPNAVAACGTSHYNLWRYIKNNYSELKYAIIIEDDVFILKKELEKYKNIIKNKLEEEKNLLINNTTAISWIYKKEDDYFNNTRISFGLNTYFITPETADNLATYFEKNKVTYHIDLELSLIKESINLKIFNLIPILFKDINKTESSMISTHKKVFIQKLLLEKKGFFSKPYFEEFYKNLNTPLVQITKDLVINSYSIIVFFIFLILLYLTFNLFDIGIKGFIINSFLWFILGILVYDFF